MSQRSWSLLACSGCSRMALFQRLPSPIHTMHGNLAAFVRPSSSMKSSVKSVSKKKADRRDGPRNKDTYVPGWEVEDVKDVYMPPPTVRSGAVAHWTFTDKQKIADLHKLNPETYSVEKLAEQFKMRTERVRTLIEFEQLREMRKEKGLPVHEDLARSYDKYVKENIKWDKLDDEDLRVVNTKELVDTEDVGVTNMGIVRRQRLRPTFWLDDDMGEAAENYVGADHLRDMRRASYRNNPAEYGKGLATVLKAQRPPPDRSKTVLMFTEIGRKLKDDSKRRVWRVEFEKGKSRDPAARTVREATPEEHAHESKIVNPPQHRRWS